MEQYWNLVQARVCHKCIDGDRKGNCLLPADQSCAVVCAPSAKSRALTVFAAGEKPSNVRSTGIIPW